MMEVEIQSAKVVAVHEAKGNWSPGKIAGLLSAVYQTLPMTLGAVIADNVMLLSSF